MTQRSKRKSMDTGRPPWSVCEAPEVSRPWTSAKQCPPLAISKSPARYCMRPAQFFPHSTEFSGGTCHCSSKASRGKDLEVEEPVARGDCASFHFHATLAGLQGPTL